MIFISKWYSNQNNVGSVECMTTVLVIQETACLGIASMRILMASSGIALHSHSTIYHNSFSERSCGRSANGVQWHPKCDWRKIRRVHWRGKHVYNLRGTFVDVSSVRSGIIQLIKSIRYPLKAGEYHYPQHIIHISLGRHSNLNTN